MGLFRVGVVAAELQVKQLAAHPFMVFNALAAPFFFALTASYMLRHQPSFDPVYVAVGAGLTGTWSVVLFTGSAAIAQERSQGTLELLSGSPSSLFAVMAGKMAGSQLFAGLSMVFSYVVVLLLFGREVSIADPLAFALFLGFTFVSFWALGMLFAPLAILWPAADRFLSGLEYPVYILGAFLSTVALLPLWMRPLSLLLPPFWGAAALHRSSSGLDQGVDPLAAAVVLMLSSALALLASRRLFVLLLRRARTSGTLAYT